PAGQATNAPQQGTKAKMPAMMPRQMAPIPSPMHTPLLLLLLVPLLSASRRYHRRGPRSSSSSRRGRRGRSSSSMASGGAADAIGGDAEGCTATSGGSSAAGTWSTALHLGHLIFLPAAVSGARSVAPHCEQVTLIGMMGLGEVGGPAV